MVKINKHIQIVRSSNTWLSSMSQVSSDAIFKVLSDKYMNVGVSTVNDIDDLDALIELKPDLVFLGMKFIPARDVTYSQHSDKIWISDYLDMHNIPYTGSEREAHELELDKSLAKERINRDGLNTSDYLVIRQDQVLTIEEFPESLSFPLFVKPSNRGGGLGIDEYSIVNNFEELQSKVTYIKDILKSDSLIERYLSGREFSVVVLRDITTDEINAYPIELVAPVDEHGLSMLSGQVKSSNAEIVSRLDASDIKDAVNNLAKSSFMALGGRDYGRIDIRLDEYGVPQFLEANILPSLIEDYGSFPKSCLLNLGLEHKAMIIYIVNLAFSRPTIIEDFDNTSTEVVLELLPV